MFCRNVYFFSHCNVVTCIINITNVSLHARLAVLTLLLNCCSTFWTIYCYFFMYIVKCNYLNYSRTLIYTWLITFVVLLAANIHSSIEIFMLWTTIENMFNNNNNIYLKSNIQSMKYKFSGLLIVCWYLTYVLNVIYLYIMQTRFSKPFLIIIT